MKRVITPTSNCIDVGCHKGEILDDMLKYAPNGIHFGFEPIPFLFAHLKDKYLHKATIFPYALSDKTGTTTFQFVKNAPAYSGIIKRKYDTETPNIEEITVDLKTLDEVIDKNLKIDFIKIDVEGGEFGVLKGAEQLLKKNKPIIVFECGLGGSDYYDTTPNDLYDFISNTIGLKISTLKSFVNNTQTLTIQDFEYCFNSNKEYYFIAHS
ncbi:MAG: FkbM family methyltransferase [Bacteroidia bacterium]|nr:FkbM family methyltransferase [Bacteroidia bacterium]